MNLSYIYQPDGKMDNIEYMEVCHFAAILFKLAIVDVPEAQRIAANALSKTWYNRAFFK